MLFSKFHEFIPKSYLYLRKGYKFSIFKKDLLAGLTVGTVALPLAMAFAIASGVGPERGLYTAIIAGFLISALGGSRIQVGGPTASFVIISYEIIQKMGYNGLCASMVVASVILIFLGILRVGSWIKYIPHPLVIGFTTGMSVVIFSMQIKDFFGLKIDHLPVNFTGKWLAYFDAFSSFNPIALYTGIGALSVILLIRRFVPWFPWGVTVIVVTTIVCSLFNIRLETIRSHFGELSRSLPLPSVKHLLIQIGNFKEILTNGIIIAFLASVESLLSAVVGDGMIGGKHRSNCELVALGIANFGSFVFGGIPASGAIARTVVNIKTGAQTPMAGMVHALFLAFILYCLAPVVSKIPLVAFSAVMIMTSWNMSKISHFIRLLRAPCGDRIVLLITFILTVFVDLTVAISVGMILASFIFMKQMSQMSSVVPLSKIFHENIVDFPERCDYDDISKKVIPCGVEVYEVQGPFFFGAANMLRDILNHLIATPQIFILRMRSIPMIDASGMHGIEEFYDQCKKKNIILFLSGIHGQTLIDLKKFGLVDIIGEEYIFQNINDALAKARVIIK